MLWGGVALRTPLTAQEATKKVGAWIRVAVRGDKWAVKTGNSSRVGRRCKELGQALGSGTLSVDMMRISITQTLVNRVRR